MERDSNHPLLSVFITLITVTPSYIHSPADNLVRGSR
jgi:hypothetical protein